MKKILFITLCCILLHSVAFAEDFMDKSVITPIPTADSVYVADGGVADGRATIAAVLEAGESTLEAVMDLQDMQGAVTDAQVPNDITITNLSGTNTGDNTVATSGDSATAFFASGEIADAQISNTLTCSSNTGNSATATALAANPAAATAGSCITDIDASGDVEAEVDVWTEAENTSAGYTSTVDEVGTLTTGDLCINDGSSVNCTVNTIAELETALDAEDILTATEGAAAYQPLEATLTDIADGTIVENLVNTTSPWADNEVSDTLTASVIDLEAGTVTNIAINEIMVGVGAGDASYVSLSGDATLDSAGVLTVADDSHAHVVGNIDAAASATWADQITDELGSGNILFGDQSVSTGDSVTFSSVEATTLTEGGNAVYNSSDDLFIKLAGDVATAGTYDFGEASVVVELPNADSSTALGSAGEVHLNTAHDTLAFHMGASGEVTGEAVISLIRHISAVFDPAGWYDQESTNRVVPLMTVGDDALAGITITEWNMDYVGGDPTTELDADLMCDTTPNWSSTDDSVTMDAVDTTAGTSTATTGFDSATCANGSKLYLHFDADPSDDSVVTIFELYFYNNDD